MNNYLKGIRERCEKATPDWSPREIHDLQHYYLINRKTTGENLADFVNQVDRDFALFARIDLPLLLDCLEKAMGGLEQISNHDGDRWTEDEYECLVRQAPPQLIALQTLESIHKRLEVIEGEKR